MTDHDPLCPLNGTPGPCGWCVRIAKVRADERERIATEVRDLRPYRWGRVSKGLVLGIIDGPARITPPSGAIWRIVWR